MRVADYIIKYLEDIGVKHIFTVTGGGSIFLCDALARNKNIEYVCCHHEQTVATAAEAYARVKNGIGVSLVTTGPGGTNAITGVAGSWMDSVPHLTISGQAFLNQTIGNSGLRQLGVQEINIIDLVRPITKYAVMVEDPQSIKYHLQKALYLASSGRPGPVWLDLPANIQMAEIDEKKLVEFSPSEIIIQYDIDLKDKVKRVVELLKTSKRPLIHVGQGVKLGRAVDDFMHFVERNKLPFVTARNANDLVSWDHDLLVGRPGTFAQRGANFALQNADFYLAIGTRLSLPQTGYNAKDFARNATKVMVDVDKAELEKKTLNIDIKVHASAKEFLRELNHEMERCNINVSEWVSQCALWKKKYPVVLPHYKEQKEFVNSYYFTDVLSDLLDSNDVIVTDMGIAFQGTHQALRVKKGQKFFTNSGFASMGWGLPGAIGACFGNERKRTICVAGDGGLLMTVQELSTIMYHRLPVKLFILNNGGYLTIKQTQELGFNGRLMGVNSETGLSFPDFLKLSDAHGIEAIRISNHTGLKENLQKVLKTPGPFICEIMMDPNQEQSPKAINRRKADGTFEPTPLEDLYPFLDREELKENMISEREKDLNRR